MSDALVGSMLTSDELSDLRQVLEYIRETLNLSRAKLADDARVPISDIDNFTQLDKRARQSKYKTMVPRVEFQKRLIYYLFTDENVVSHFEKISSNEREKYVQLRRFFKKSIHCDAGDELYNYYLNSRIISGRDECIAICQNLAGSYYVHKRDTKSGLILNAFLQVHRYDEYSILPKFTYKRHTIDKTGIMTTTGLIFNINNRYVFTGFHDLGENNENIIGTKTIILNTRQDDDMWYYGICLSPEVGGSYTFGKILLQPTKDKFDLRKIIPCDPEDSNISVDRLYLYPSNTSHMAVLRNPIMYDFKIPPKK